MDELPVTEVPMDEEMRCEKNPLQLSCEGYNACLSLNDEFMSALVTLKTPVAKGHSPDYARVYDVKKQKISQSLQNISKHLQTIKNCHTSLEEELPFTKQDAQDFLLGLKEVETINSACDNQEELEDQICRLKHEINNKNGELKQLQKRLFDIVHATQVQ